MEIHITGKQVDLGDALRDHINAKLNQEIGKFFNDSLDCQVTISHNDHRFKTDISVHVSRGLDVRSADESFDAYSSFDGALERLINRIARYKNRIKDHHKQQLAHESFKAQSFVVDLADYEEEETPSDSPSIIAEMTTEILTLTVSEAVMKMDLMDSNALMFINKSNNAYNMIYRRRDGNIGWVDPSLKA